MKLKRICPICNCDDGEKLYEINFAKSKNEFIVEHYDIVSCYNCGFIFNNTEWTQRDYDKYYSETSKYTNNFTSGAGGLSDLDLKRYNDVINRIEQFINKKSSILDIGCAKGGLLRTFKDRGYNNLYGIEPSEDAINHLKTFGIDGKCLSLFEANKLNKKFDVVILTQVLEHIFDLERMKSILKDLLNEDGILYVDIPDGTSYIKNNLNSYYYFDLEHINHFSNDTLKYLFNDLETIKIDNSYFDNVSDIKAYIIYGIFKNSKDINRDVLSLDKMKEYIEESDIKDNYLINIDNTKPTYLWGFGAYLRRLLLDYRYFNNINIAGIIDKNKSLNGLKIKNYKNDELEIFNPDILKNNIDANIIITSVLYSKQIEADLLRDNSFRGKIYKLHDRSDQIRSDQIRSDQIRSCVMLEYANNKKVA